MNTPKINLEEATSMSLDEIIRLQKTRSRAPQDVDSAKKISMFEPGFSGSWTGSIISKKNPGKSQPTVVRCNVQSLGRPSCSFQRVTFDLPEHDLRNKINSVQETDHTSSSEEEDNRLIDYLIGNLTEKIFHTDENADDPPPQSRGGNSIARKQQGLAQNHRKKLPGHGNTFVNRTNFKRKPGKVDTCQKGCCTNRCRAQKRLEALISSLKVKQRHHPRMPSVPSNNSSLKRSMSCENLAGCPSSTFGGGFFSSNMTELGGRQSRSRSPVSSNPNGFPPDVIMQNRSRSLSRDNYTSRNLAQGQCGHMVQLRKDQIYSSEIQSEIAALKKCAKPKTPFKTELLNGDSWEPVVHRTYVTMTTRFGNYYS